MITREQIPTVLDHQVRDADGHKIGEAKHVFLDDATGRPEWITVKTGLFGSNETFVPTKDAIVVEDHLEVPYTKDTVKDAPNVDVDGKGHLSEQEEHRLYEHYGIDWDSAWQRANTPGQDGWAHDGAAGAGGAGDGAGGAAGAAGAVGAAGIAGTAGYAAAAAPGKADAETPTGAAGTPGMAAATGAARGAADDKSAAGRSMTRSEEQMHVGTERRESGKARLRKYIVTEEVQQTVPLRHEEIRVERETITDADRDASLTGVEIAEAEYEVTLHEERPVVQTETVAVERVRLSTEEFTEQETVRGEIRKEQIETDVVQPDQDRDRKS